MKTQQVGCYLFSSPLLSYTFYLDRLPSIIFLYSLFSYIYLPLFLLLTFHSDKESYTNQCDSWRILKYQASGFSWGTNTTKVGSHGWSFKDCKSAESQATKDMPSSLFQTGFLFNLIPYLFSITPFKSFLLNSAISYLSWISFITFAPWIFWVLEPLKSPP